MIDHILNMTPEIVNSYQLTVIGMFFLLLLVTNLYGRKLIPVAVLVMILFLTLGITFYAVAVNLTDISSNSELRINLIGYSPIKQNFSFRVLQRDQILSEKTDCISPPQKVADCVAEIELRESFKMDHK